MRWCGACFTHLMGDSLSCACMDPIVSARILKGLMWGNFDCVDIEQNKMGGVREREREKG